MISVNDVATCERDNSPLQTYAVSLTFSMDNFKVTSPVCVPLFSLSWKEGSVISFSDAHYLEIKVLFIAHHSIIGYNINEE